MPKKQGNFTLKMQTMPSISSFAAIAAKKEADGPMAQYFDIICEDSSMGEETWEKSESHMQKDVINKALEKGKLSTTDIDYIFAGDLLNQCTATAYGIREMGMQFFGLYGACSTMAESLALSAIMVDTQTADRCIAMTSSHFCSAERQFRYPLEYAGQRTPTSQWTVTGAGAAVVSKNSSPPYIKAVTIGKIEDLGIKDINNMGAAMAPAAASTLKRFFEDTLTNQDNYDLILTGDLGEVGTSLFLDLMARDGYKIEGKHSDCGLLIFDREKMVDVNAGGSGCGCSASVLCSYILSSIKEGRLNEVLFIATGALMSPTSVQQQQTIPSIAHLIYLSNNCR